MMTVLIFIIVLGILVFVHELGHFVAARASGIRVDAFALGFGPKLFSWKRGETEYSIRILPLGGYVKIHGENPDEESVSGPDAGRSFVNKPRWKQIVVLVAGVTCNFIFAWILYSGAFMFGVTATPEGFEKYTDHMENARVMITYISPDSPAEKVGLKSGDIIIGAKPAPATYSASSTASTMPRDTTTLLPTVAIDYVQKLINVSEGRPILISVARQDTLVDTVVVAKTGLIATSTYAIGISMQNVADLKLPFFSAIFEGFRYMLVMIRDTAVGLYHFVINIFLGQAKLSDVSGPVGIAGIVGDAAHLGFTYLVMITALISINLGVINLVPFPALDGGRVLFVLIEGAIRRRISMKFTNMVNTIGFGLLMLLMIVITYKDLAKLFK